MKKLLAFVFFTAVSMALLHLWASFMALDWEWYLLDNETSQLGRVFFPIFSLAIGSLTVNLHGVDSTK